jgi:hypothetical protein
MTAQDELRALLAQFSPATREKLQATIAEIIEAMEAFEAGRISLAEARRRHAKAKAELAEPAARLGGTNIVGFQDAGLIDEETTMERRQREKLALYRLRHGHSPRLSKQCDAGATLAHRTGPSPFHRTDRSVHGVRPGLGASRNAAGRRMLVHWQKRLGRKLKPHDVKPKDPLNQVPGSAR